MADIMSPPERSRMMSLIGNKGTKPERLMREEFRRLGFRPRENDSSLPGSPDFVFYSGKVVVLVHGCFWHRHEGCTKATTPSTRKKFWQKKFLDNTRRDSRVERILRKSGWSVLTVWECHTKTAEREALRVIRRVRRRREKA